MGISVLWEDGNETPTKPNIVRWTNKICQFLMERLYTPFRLKNFNPLF